MSIGGIKALFRRRSIRTRDENGCGRSSRPRGSIATARQASFAGIIHTSPLQRRRASRVARRHREASHAAHAATFVRHVSPRRRPTSSTAAHPECEARSTRYGRLRGRSLTLDYPTDYPPGYSAVWCRMTWERRTRARRCKLRTIKGGWPETRADGAGDISRRPVAVGGIH